MSIGNKESVLAYDTAFIKYVAMWRLTHTWMVMGFDFMRKCRCGTAAQILTSLDGLLYL